MDLKAGKIIKLKGLLTILILFVSFTSFAQIKQSFRFEHYNTTVGLSGNNINDITQDSLGFIWIATDDGLNRFDGYDFVKISEIGLNKYLIPSDHINCIVPASKSDIYIGSLSGGIYKFNSLKFSFERIFEGKSSHPLEKSDIRSILPYNKDILLIATLGKGIWKYHIKQKKAERIAKIIPQNITGICLDSNTLIAGTEGEGLLLYDLYTNNVIKHIQKDYKVIGNDSISFVKKIGKRVFFGTYHNGVYEVSKNKILQLTIAQDIKYPSSITIDKQSNIWIGSNRGEGVLVCNEQKETKNWIKSDETDPNSLSTNTINTLFTDAFGKVYLSGYGTGMDAIFPEMFGYQLIKKKEGGLNNNDVRFIFTEPNLGGLFYGTYGGGLNVTNEIFGTMLYLRNKFGDRTSISSDYLQCIEQVSDEQILVGTWEGLSILDANTIQFETYSPNEDFSYGRKFAILAIATIIPEKKYLTATSLDGIGYLYDFDLEAKKFTKISLSQEADEVIKRFPVTCITSLNKNIYILTKGGGMVIIDKDGKSRVLKAKKGIKNQLISNKLNHAIVLANNYLIIATEGAGLAIYNTINGLFYPILAQHGFKPLNAFSLIMDTYSSIWVSTTTGVSRIRFSEGIKKFIDGYEKKDFTSLKVKDFGRDNNIPSIDFNANSVAEGFAETIYFGGKDGVLSVSAQEIVENRAKPKSYIYGLQIFDKIITPDIEEEDNVTESDIMFLKDINLSYKQNFLTFYFTGLNYINPEKNQFAYQLEGVDNGWIITDYKRRNAAYSGLTPGTYIFKVKTANNDGLWGAETRLTIYIQPPFWSTWWFRILSAIILLSATYVIVKQRLKIIREQAQKEAEINKQISDAKLIALRSQMNPHFIFNSLNSIQQFIYENKKEEAGKYLTKFAKLIRQILQSSSDNNILLEDEIEMLKLYLELESMRFQGKFSFEFILEDDIEPEFIEIPTMLLQPFLENAILHGLATKDDNGHIDIYVEDAGNKTLKVTIDDDGIGRKKAKEIKKQKLYKYKSMGMEVTENRLEILNQHQGKNVAVEIIDKEDKDGNGLGTKVIIFIPFEEV